MKIPTFVFIRYKLRYKPYENTHVDSWIDHIMLK